jgi:hypothetical protein
MAETIHGRGKKIAEACIEWPAEILGSMLLAPWHGAAGLALGAYLSYRHAFTVAFVLSCSYLVFAGILLAYALIWDDDSRQPAISRILQAATLIIGLWAGYVLVWRLMS